MLDALKQPVANLPRRRLGLLLIAMTLCMASTTIFAAMPAQTIDPKLNRETIRLVNIDQGYVSYFDSDRNLQQGPLDQFMAIRLTATPAKAGEQAVPASDEPVTVTSPEPRLRPAPIPERLLLQLRAEGGPQAVEAVLEGRIAQLEQRIANAEDAGESTQPEPTLVPAEPAAQPFQAVRATAFLADGQIVHGRWHAMADDGQTAIWLHPVAGRLSIPLDRLRLILLKPSQAAEDVTLPQGMADAVVFQNGDKLQGFIQGVTGEGVDFLPDGANDAVRLPLNTCEALQIGNGYTLPTDAPYRLVFADGSRIDCRTVSFAKQQWRFEAVLAMVSTVEATCVASYVTDLEIMSSDRVMVPLWQLPLEPAQASVFGLAMPVKLGRSAITLQAPLRWQLALPAGSMKLSMVARSIAGPWTDVTLKLTPVGASKPAIDKRLDAENPQVAVDVNLEKPRVILELDAGLHGPIMDRVELLDAFVVVKRP